MGGHPAQGINSSVESYFGKIIATKYFTSGLTDYTQALQSAIDDGLTYGKSIVLPPGVWPIKNLVSVTSGAYLEIEGMGQNTVLIDENTTDPMLSITAANMHFKLSNFKVKLGVDKPTGSSISSVGVQTGRFKIRDLSFDGQSGAGHRIGNLLLLQDIWEGDCDEIGFSSVAGGSISYTCPTYNGGNVEFRNVFGYYCSRGIFTSGAAMLNNLHLNNVKFVNDLTHFDYYTTLTANAPQSGAVSITIDTGLAIGNVNGLYALLYSSAGMEMVMCSSYNSTTGALALVSGYAVSLNHSTADTRIMIGNWGLVTDALVPNLQADCCHFEGARSFLKDSTGARLTNTLISPVTSTNDNNWDAFFVCGQNSENCTFENTQLGGQTGLNVYLANQIYPTSSGANTTSVFINRVSTFPINLASQKSTATIHPLRADGQENTYGQAIVYTSASKGIERYTEQDNITIAWGATTPTLPSGTGSTNKVTNSKPYAMVIYQTGAVGTHIIDHSGYSRDNALPSDPPSFRLNPGEAVYYATTVPSVWMWYAEAYYVSD